MVFRWPVYRDVSESATFCYKLTSKAKEVLFLIQVSLSFHQSLYRKQDWACYCRLWKSLVRLLATGEGWKFPWNILMVGTKKRLLILKQYQTKQLYGTICIRKSNYHILKITKRDMNIFFYIREKKRYNSLILFLIIQL